MNAHVLKKSMLLLAILFLLTACGKTHHNEVSYRFVPREDAVEIDSLKISILSGPGTEMMIMYPDCMKVVIRYDRYKTHQDIIESCFIKNGYEIELLSKKRIEKKSP